MTTLVFDLETTIETYHKRKASPFCPNNWVVAAGYGFVGTGTQGHYYADRMGYQYHAMPLQGVTTLIAFNAKFDLLWSWNKPELKAYFKRGGTIWCCQYAHYLLEGMTQAAQMVSLDSIIENYGGVLKIDEVKALWEAGVNTPDIDETLLMTYLDGDIKNTRLMYEEQVRRAKALHPMCYQMILNRMDGLLATTEMEYRGLQIDAAIGEYDRTTLSDEHERISERLDQQLPELPAEFEFNWQSNHHRSYLLFGGCTSYKRWLHTTVDGVKAYAVKTDKVHVKDEKGEFVRYKSGKRQGQIKCKNVKSLDLDRPKGKLHEFLFRFDGITKPKPEWIGKQKDAVGDPIYSTGADIISILGNRNIPFLKDLAAGQKLSKDIGTYYWKENKHGKRKGMLTLVGADGRIHHKLNHTSTVTGRLSSSDPNMQNIPRGDKSLAKRMFVSRFGKAGRIIEADYSQLEVIVQGVLTRDVQLCEDIRNGVDFHIKRLAASTNRPYDELKALHLSHDSDISSQRTAIKGFTFQRAYGAGATAISDSTGMSIDQVKALIEDELKLYPGIEAFDKRLAQEIEDSVLDDAFAFVDGARMRVKRGEWFSPTGTRYIWTQKEAPQFLKDRGILMSFSPTTRKNWPVQGLGGEIVETMIGKLWRHFVANNNYNNQAYLVNTVHDSGLIDCHEDVVAVVARHTCSILSNVPNVFNRCFNLGIDVPFPVEAKVGLNWYEMEEMI